jgi:hypothetical protein
MYFLRSRCGIRSHHSERQIDPYACPLLFRRFLQAVDIKFPRSGGRDDKAAVFQRDRLIWLASFCLLPAGRNGLAFWLMSWLSVRRYCRDHPIRVGLLVVLLLLIVVLNDR